MDFDLTLDDNQVMLLALCISDRIEQMEDHPMRDEEEAIRQEIADMRELESLLRKAEIEAEAKG